MFINERQSTMYNNSNFFQCVLDEQGNIFKVDFWGGNPIQIGVTQDKYNEAIKVATDFQNKLIDLGVLEKEKTAEEIQKENNNLLNQLLNQFNNINQRLELLEQNNNNVINTNNINNNIENFRGEENESNDKKYHEGSNKQIKSKSK